MQSSTTESSREIEDDDFFVFSSQERSKADSKANLEVYLDSRGQKSRVPFATSRMCMFNPNFLVLDEPTYHLDIETNEALGKAVQKYTVSLNICALTLFITDLLPTYQSTTLGIINSLFAKSFLLIQ